MTDTALTQLDNEIIVTQLVRLYKFRVEHPEYSTKSACEELGLSYRAVLEWLKEGRLSDYVAEIKDPRSDIAQITALESLVDVVAYQVKIATGVVQIQGVSPVAAAKFLLDVAKLETQAGRGNLTQVNVFVPQVGEASSKPGAPTMVVDAPGKVKPEGRGR